MSPEVVHAVVSLNSCVSRNKDFSIGVWFFAMPRVPRVKQGFDRAVEEHAVPLSSMHFTSREYET